MNKDQVLASLSKAKDLSTPPTILKEILNLINDQDVSNKDLSEVILKDPSLTAHLLKIANSSFYGVSREVLVEKRTQATLESLRISPATLSHYLNNAIMNIQGKCEIMRMHYGKQDFKTIVTSLPNYLESIMKSAKKITLMLEELSEISSLDKLHFFGHSKAIDIENDLKAKLAQQFETVEKSSG